MQVVVEAAASRCGGPGAEGCVAGAGSFAMDMPVVLPLSRWDVDAEHASCPAGRVPNCFGAVMDGKCGAARATHLVQHMAIVLDASV